MRQARWLNKSKSWTVGHAGAIASDVADSFQAGYGVVPDPPGAAPRKVVTKLNNQIEGAQTVKVRYGTTLAHVDGRIILNNSGPFNVPAMTKKNLLGEYGMLANLPKRDLET